MWGDREVDAFYPVKNILDIEMKDMNYGFWDMIRRWKFLHCPVALCSYEFLY